MNPPSGAGLQAERTGLAWSRASLAVAGNAVLLAAREISHLTPSVALVPAALTLVVAAATAIYGRHRTTTLRRQPLPSPLAARIAVPVLSGAVVLLTELSGLAMTTGSLC